MVRLMKVAVLGVWLLSAAQARAQDAMPGSVKEAQEHYFKGKDLYAKGDFDAAARELLAAYEAAPTPDLLFNIAKAYEAAKKLDEATIYYQRYLLEAKDPPDRVRVEATVKRLREEMNKQNNKRANKRELQERAMDRQATGRVLFKAGKYQEALLELQAAYDIFPSAPLAYNMA